MSHWKKQDAFLWNKLSVNEYLKFVLTIRELSSCHEFECGYTHILNSTTWFHQPPELLAAIVDETYCWDITLWETKKHVGQHTYKTKSQEQKDGIKISLVHYITNDCEIKLNQNTRFLLAEPLKGAQEPPVVWPWCHKTPKKVNIFHSFFTEKKHHVLLLRAINCALSRPAAECKFTAGSCVIKS